MTYLENKWVLITGSASGIGQAMAVEFAGAGSNIIIADINEEGMKDTAALVEAKGRKAICIKTDMRRPDEIKALAERAIKEASRVDILVNNAGRFLLCETPELSVEEWEEILAVNLRGPILLIHYFLPHMISRGSGHIVNTASIAGLVGLPLAIPYCTSKFGMVGLSESLRVELRRYGIFVSVVCPGLVSSPMMDNKNVRGFKLELDRSNPPPLITITPERAARIIVRGVMRKKAKIFPSSLTPKLLVVIKRISETLNWLVLRAGYALFRWKTKE